MNSILWCHHKLWYGGSTMLGDGKHFYFFCCQWAWHLHVAFWHRFCWHLPRALYESLAPALLAAVVLGHWVSDSVVRIWTSDTPSAVVACHGIAPPGRDEDDRKPSISKTKKGHWSNILLVCRISSFKCTSSIMCKIITKNRPLFVVTSTTFHDTALFVWLVALVKWCQGTGARLDSTDYSLHHIQEALLRN